MKIDPNDPHNKVIEAKPLKLTAPQEPYQPLKAEVSALQALQRGEATAHQQKLALECIIANISGAYARAEFRTDQREQDFGLGRAFVGQQIIGILKINLMAFLNRQQNT